MNNNRMHRRTILKTSAAAAAGLALPWLVPARALGTPNQPGANERVTLGVIGIGNRAKQLLDNLPAGAQVVSVADCYLRRAQEAVKEKRADWKIYHDYRKMFDAEKLDAVIVATPDHGRVLPCIVACQAGLDVYAEKPLTTYISEGRALVNAVRRYNRVLQVGSQQRTMEMNRFACEFVRNGGIGKLKHVLCVNYPGPARCPGFPAQPIPETDNWDMWCGPTELKPFSGQLQFGWSRWRDYSGGDMTNWGAHGLDQVQWALGASESGPVELWPMTEGPTAKIAMRYANGVEVRLELDRGPRGGAVFVGEKGKVEINRNKYTTNPPDLIKNGPEPAKAEAWEGPGWIAKPHIQNWLDCIKTRQRPNADVEIGHRSVSVCHLGNIVRELGRRLHWDPNTETFVKDDEANALVSRPRRQGYELPTIS